MHFYISQYIKVIHILIRYFFRSANNLLWFFLELGEANPLIVDTLRELLKKEEKEKQDFTYTIL